MKLELSQITPAPWNTRGEITPASVVGLARSIEAQGLLNPITVWMDEYGNGWYCIAGHRRLAALRAIGAEEAECVEFKGTREDAKLVTVTENLQREGVGPIEEAALVAACLDEGLTADEIAAKLGRSTSWVNRRRRLLSLDEAWRKVAANFTAWQLETIAAYPAEVQAEAAKDTDPGTANWEAVKWRLERESRALGLAKFDTSACRACLKRTGADADLFGVIDGKLGACMDGKCYKRKEAARIAELIDKATKGANEVVRLGYEWQLPREDESSAKRTKKHPCAYVHEYNGEVVVRWGESLKAKKEREAQAAREREAQAAADAAERKTKTEAREKLERFFSTDNGEWPEGLIGKVAMLINANAPETAAEFATEAICEKLCEWHDREEWAHILRSLDFVAEIAGLTEDEIAAILKNGNDGR